MIGKEYLKDLKQTKYKYNEEEIIFITKDSEGNLVWLERGNEGVGLKHIIAHHKNDFENAVGIKENEIALYLYEVLTNGKLIKSNPSKKGGFNKVYKYDGNYYTFVAMGNNGFIVTSYPVPKERGEKL